MPGLPALGAIRETLELHTRRFITIERRLDGFEHKLDVLGAQMAEVVQRLPKP